VTRRTLLLPCLITAIPLAYTIYGCHSHPFSESAAQSRAEEQAVQASERQQLDMIPPPAKSRFMAIHSDESWQNPSITVQAGMLQLRVTLEDVNDSPIGAGGMLRPVAARQHELNIGMDKLDEAVSSIPQNAWPYGRVVAVEEPNNTPPSAEPQVRRNMETVIRKLSDLGVVVYDLRDGNVR